jgi:hypothetical protein
MNQCSSIEHRTCFDTGPEGRELGGKLKTKSEEAYITRAAVSIRGRVTDQEHITEWPWNSNSN